MKTFNSVRKRLPHSYFSVNFDKFLGKPFCRTPTSNHFPHYVFFSFFQISEVCSSILCSYGNQVETSLSVMIHMDPFRHSNSWRSATNGRTEKIVNVGWILLLCHGTSRKNIREKLEIANFNSWQKVQDCLWSRLE